MTWFPKRHPDLRAAHKAKIARKKALNARVEATIAAITRQRQHEALAALKGVRKVRADWTLEPLVWRSATPISRASIDPDWHRKPAQRARRRG